MFKKGLSVKGFKLGSEVANIELDLLILYIAAITFIRGAELMQWRGYLHPTNVKVDLSFSLVLCFATEVFLWILLFSPAQNFKFGLGSVDKKGHPVNYLFIVTYLLLNLVEHVGLA